MDYYEMLEVSPSASQKVITAAYRTLCQMYHPDKNNDDPNARKTMASINQAYSVLSNEVARKAYDERSASQLSSANNIENDAKSPPAEIRIINSDPFQKFYAFAIVPIAIMLGYFYFSENEATTNAPPAKTQFEIETEKFASSLSYAEDLIYGKRVPQNYTKAMEVLKSLTIDEKSYKGFSWGRVETLIADMYYKGLGVDIDKAEAAKWYKSATASGASQAYPAFMLGNMYEQGSGVIKSNVLAYRYYNIAAARRNDLTGDYQEKAKIRKSELEKNLTTSEINNAQNIIE